MLLPAGKHTGKLMAAIAESPSAGERVNAKHIHVGPAYLPHGCGLHSSWGEQASDFLKEAFSLAKGEAGSTI